MLNEERDLSFDSLILLAFCLQQRDETYVTKILLLFDCFRITMTDNLSKSLKSTEHELSWANRGLKANCEADGK